MLDYAGQDASKVFHLFHNYRLLQKYHDKLVVGQLDADDTKTPKVKAFKKPEDGFGE